MKHTASILAVLVLGLYLQNCTPDQELFTDNPYIKEVPLVIAHGGAKQLWPENTMVAFDGSVALEVDVLELDMMMTKDDSLVCHHDDDIDRMSDGSGYIWDFTVQELRAFNFGDGFEDLDGNFPYKDQYVEITKLEDLFIKYPLMSYIVEIKDQGERGNKAGELLFQLIEKYNIHSIIVASFYEDVLDHFNEYTEYSIPISTSEDEAKSFVYTSLFRAPIFYKPKAVALQLPMESSGINLTTKHIIKSAHKRNMAIHYWTINDKDDMTDLIEKGADGLITDRPDIMMDLLKELGLK